MLIVIEDKTHAQICRIVDDYLGNTEFGDLPKVVWFAYQKDYFN